MVYTKKVENEMHVMRLRGVPPWAVGGSFICSRGKAKAFFSTGIYGIEVIVCTHCGRISELFVDVDA